MRYEDMPDEETAIDPAELTAVQVVRRKGQALLVEWTDEYGDRQRSIVPAAAVVQAGEQAVCESPEQGIVYGEDWAALAPVPATEAEKANELKRRGIWTVDDLLANGRVVTSIYGIDAQGLIRSARMAHKEDNS